MKITVKEFVKLDIQGLMQINGGTRACGNYSKTQPATPPSGGNETNNAPSNNGGNTGGSGSDTPSSYSPSYSNGSTTGTSTGTCGGTKTPENPPATGDNPAKDDLGGGNNISPDTGTKVSTGGCSSLNGGNGNGDKLKGKEEDDLPANDLPENTTPAPEQPVIDENTNKLTLEDISSSPDKVDYSKTSWVKDAMDSAGYDFLSDDNSNGYVAGSERNYYQSEFINAINNPDVKVTRDTHTIEGSVGAGFGHENYYEYSIVHKETGVILFQFADINGDGKVDYVKR